MYRQQVQQECTLNLILIELPPGRIKIYSSILDDLPYFFFKGVTIMPDLYPVVRITR